MLREQLWHREDRNQSALCARGQFAQEQFVPPELVEHFFVKSREKNGRPNLVLPASLLPYFSGYRWPGNVRELENIVERLVVLSRGDEITLEDLPEFLRRTRASVEELHLDLPPQGISLEAVEKELILRALKKFNWNQSQAARYLDLSRKTLIYRMEKFGLRREAGDEAEA
jgi:two-component system NtrC family response regulator